MKSRRSAGFTLTELMVAVIGLGFLALLILPATLRAQGCGRNQACMSNLSNLWKLARIYQSRFAGWMKCMPLEMGRDFWQRLMDDPYPLVDGENLDVFLCPVKANGDLSRLVDHQQRAGPG